VGSEGGTLAARPIWSGFLKLSLVTVPVKAYTATDSGGQVHFNQLHAECKSRMKNVKECPVHGEVTDDQIISGHEYAKGQYVTIEPEELDRLRTPADKMIGIDAFVSPETIDPIYLSGKAYYLVPEGKAGGHPFALLREGMVAENKFAVAKVVMFGREQIVLLRPAGSLLEMFVLDYAATVKQHTEFADLVPKVDVDPKEVEAAKTLIETKTAPKLDMSAYKDHSGEQIRQLVEAKIAGKEIVAPPPAQEHAQVINLMDALKASVQQAQAAGKPAEGERPPKKVAPSTPGEEPTKRRKRKSS
jgi:DNA end-binding protein Ku